MYSHNCLFLATSTIKIRAYTCSQWYLVRATQASNQASKRNTIVTNQTTPNRNAVSLARFVAYSIPKTETNPCEHHIVEISVSIHPRLPSEPSVPMPISSGFRGPHCAYSHICKGLIVHRQQPSPLPSPTPLPPSVSDSSPCPSSLTGNPTSHSVSPSYSSLLP